MHALPINASSLITFHNPPTILGKLITFPNGKRNNAAIKFDYGTDLSAITIEDIKSAFIFSDANGEKLLVSIKALKTLNPTTGGIIIIVAIDSTGKTETVTLNITIGSIDELKDIAMINVIQALSESSPAIHALINSAKLPSAITKAQVLAAI